jgi:hypothetical protein
VFCTVVGTFLKVADTPGKFNIKLGFYSDDCLYPAS